MNENSRIKKILHGSNSRFGLTRLYCLSFSCCATWIPELRSISCFIFNAYYMQNIRRFLESIVKMYILSTDGSPTLPLLHSYLEWAATLGCRARPTRDAPRPVQSASGPRDTAGRKR